MGALTDPATRNPSADDRPHAKAALNADTHRDLEDVCDHVLSTLDTHHGEDDIALLMARVQGLPEDSVGDWTLPREPRSVGRAREYARARLQSWDLEPLVDTAELLVSELVTNALRYGEGEIRLRLLLDRTLVCEVWDAGLVQPAAAAAPATRTRAAGASSWSGSSRRPGAHAGHHAARRCGSNCRCLTGRTGWWTRRRRCSVCSDGSRFSSGRAVLRRWKSPASPGLRAAEAEGRPAVRVLAQEDPAEYRAADPARVLVGGTGVRVPVHPDVPLGQLPCLQGEYVGYGRVGAGVQQP